MDSSAKICTFVKHMGYNGSNRKSVADRQQGFSKSAGKTADRIFFGPQSFRNAINKAIVSDITGASPSNEGKKKKNDCVSTKTDQFLAKEVLETENLYKCDCGKISSLSKSHPYCPACGRRLSEDHLISKEEAGESLKTGCLGLIIIPMIIGISLILL